jgi:L-ribulose-5-phosphate 3-epimerase
MTTTAPTRRHFLSLATTALAASISGVARAADKKEPFKISLAEWSLNKRMFKRNGAEPLDHLDFAKTARSFGIDGVEYVNQMFFYKATDAAYLG